MKLSLAELPNQLKHEGLRGHYLLQGDDPYLQQQAKTSLVEASNSQTEVLRFTTHHSSAWDEIAMRLQNRSLFGNLQLFFIEMTSLKLTTETQANLQTWLTATNPSYHLIISLGKLSTKDKQIAWIKKCLAVVCEVELIPPNKQRLPFFIKQALNAKGINTDIHGLNLLSHYFADNPGAALQEIEKIAYYLGEKKQIAGEELEKILVTQGQFSVFQLIDCCLAGDKTQTLQIFDTLTTDESSLILITWALAKELRLLVDLSLAIAAGDNLNQLAKQYRLWPAKVALYQAMLKHYPTLELWGLLHKLADIDKANKGLGKLTANNQLSYLLQCIACRSHCTRPTAETNKS